MTAFLSIVVPVYNREKLLPRCIDSILAQNFDNYELILVNDGSNDSSAEICNRYESSYSRITVLHSENKGSAAARNAGMKVARGTYIFFVDSDDWIEENSFSGLIEHVGESRPDLFVFGYTKKMLTDKHVHHVYSDLPRAYYPSGENIRDSLCPLLSRGIRFSLWNKFFKRSVIEKWEIGFPSFQRGQDMAFTMTFFKYAESMLIRPDRAYVHENYFDPERYTPEVFQVHLELFEKFYHLFPCWMEKRENYRYAARLFTFWFFFQIPKIIIGKNSKSEAMVKIREVMHHETVRSYTGDFKKKELKTLNIYLPLLVLNSGNEVFLYYLNIILIKAERYIKKYMNRIT